MTPIVEPKAGRPQEGDRSPGAAAPGAYLSWT
jgi:hypothetical protein